MATSKKTTARKKLAPAVREPAALLTELRGLIESARQHVAQTANATLTMLYWHVGQRIQREVLKNQRAEYGEEILPTLSAELQPSYGRGFNVSALTRMVKFAEAFPEDCQPKTPTVCWRNQPRSRKAIARLLERP